MHEDMLMASPTAALKYMQYASSMAVQFTMGAKADDFVLPKHGLEVREKKVQDMATVVGYFMRWLPAQSTDTMVADAYDYLLTKGLKEQIEVDNANEILLATGMSQEEIDLRKLATNAKARSLHDRQKFFVEERESAIKAAASEMINMGMTMHNPSLRDCEGWVINQMIAKMDMAVFGNGKTYSGRVGELFDGIMRGVSAYAGELADINNQGMKERIASTYADYESTKEQWMFEVSSAMELKNQIGDGEQPDMADESDRGDEPDYV